MKDRKTGLYIKGKTMQFWRHRPIWSLREAPTSLRAYVRIVVTMVCGLLLLLSLAVFAGAGVNQIGVSSLVDHRLRPISDLQDVTSSYEQALGIANKVKSGNLTPAGGASAIESLQVAIDRDWQSLEGEVPDHAGGVMWSVLIGEREAADKALKRLHGLLQGRDRDGLDFFLSGMFYSQVDPLLTATRTYTAGLRRMAEVEREHLRMFTIGTQAVIALVLVAGIAGGLVIFRLANRHILQPLVDIARFTAEGAIGGEDAVPHCEHGNEIGDIARAIATSRQRSVEARESLEQKHRAETALREREHFAAEAAQRRATNLDGLFARFGEGLSELVGGLAAAASAMRRMAQHMSGVSGTSEAMAVTAAGNVEDVAITMTQIEEASGTLLAMIADVERTVASSRTQVTGVYAQSQINRSHAAAMRSLVEEIFGALDLISGIAKQTDMLALNAAIEASRAGVAGEGFAVVAQEVKHLASQTQTAAQQIEGQLRRIQATSDDVLASVTRVEEMAAGVEGNADRIGEAVAVQSRSSREIVSALGHARSGTRNAADGMIDLRGHAGDVRSVAEGLFTTADDIARKAETLRAEFTRLTGEVKRAA